MVELSTQKIDSCIESIQQSKDALSRRLFDETNNMNMQVNDVMSYGEGSREMV
jgi:hypothetical protein